MKKIFISQPMHGFTYDHIISVRKKAIKKIIEELKTDDIIILGNLQVNEDYIANKKLHPNLWYLGESIKLLSEADYIVMLEDWRASKGCTIEYSIAMQYNIPILEHIDISE